MFPSWADRVARCGDSVDDLVELHKSRWSEWENYIDRLKAAGFKETTLPVSREWDKLVEKALKNTERNSVETTESQLQLDFVRKLRELSRELVSTDGDTDTVLQFKVAWAKRLLHRGDDYILLDAEFGSLNTTSDLDVNVVSTTSDVFDVWIVFTREFVASRASKDKEYAASFCEYWDSNFYYEPGVWNGKDVVPVTKKLMFDGFVWTTKSTALYELHCVKAYCDAYERGKNIVVDDMRSIPRP